MAARRTSGSMKSLSPANRRGAAALNKMSRAEIAKMARRLSVGGKGG